MPKQPNVKSSITCKLFAGGMFNVKQYCCSMNYDTGTKCWKLTMEARDFCTYAWQAHGGMKKQKMFDGENNVRKK